jgi:chemotaxis protein MotB
VAEAAKKKSAAPPPPPPPREKKERAPDPEAPGAPEWIVTFTDMISLLVTFFVLLMTFSSMEEYDPVQIKGVLQGNTGIVVPTGAARVVAPPERDVVSHTDPLKGAQEPHSRDAEFEADRENEQFRRQRENEKLRDLTDIADGLLIQWGAQASFEAGSAKPNAALRSALLDVAAVLAAYDHAIVIEGHDAPDHEATRAHPDSDSIALARAMACARILVDEGGIAPGRVQVASYGATRAKALNDSPQGRAHNRRVELRVLSMPRDRATSSGRGSGTVVR